MTSFKSMPMSSLVAVVAAGVANRHPTLESIQDSEGARSEIDRRFPAEVDRRALDCFTHCQVGDEVECQRPWKDGKAWERCVVIPPQNNSARVWFRNRAEGNAFWFSEPGGMVRWPLAQPDPVASNGPPELSAWHRGVLMQSSWGGVEVARMFDELRATIAAKDAEIVRLSASLGERFRDVGDACNRLLAIGRAAGVELASGESVFECSDRMLARVKGIGAELAGEKRANEEKAGQLAMERRHANDAWKKSTMLGDVIADICEALPGKFDGDNYVRDEILSAIAALKAPRLTLPAEVTERISLPWCASGQYGDEVSDAGGSKVLSVNSAGATKDDAAMAAFIVSAVNATVKP